MEGLAILRCGYGCNILAGLRYDHHTIAFNSPLVTSGFVVSAITDQADVNTENWIPLIGTQYEKQLLSGKFGFQGGWVPGLGGECEVV